MKTIKSYVLRQGRISPSKRDALEKLWDKYVLPLDEKYIYPQQVFANRQPLVFEIGFGMGHSLLTMAEEAPELNFIGVEVHRPGIASLLQGIEDKKLSNIRIFSGDAVQVLQQCIAENSLDKVQVFFPDPWHKQRHKKRRLIQTPFLDLLVTKLKEGGVLHLATDWDNYAQQMRRLLEEHACFVDDYSSKPVAKHDIVFPERPLTKFEQRGQRLGHAICDLIFKKRCPQDY